MVTDFSIWCNDDKTAMMSDVVLAAIMEYPQSANHTTIQGHNLFTACALMGDMSTLEKVRVPIILSVGQGFPALNRMELVMAAFTDFLSLTTQSFPFWNAGDRRDALGHRHLQLHRSRRENSEL